MKNSILHFRPVCCEWIPAIAISTFFLCNFQKVHGQCTAPIATATPSSQTICSTYDTTAILLSSDIPGTTFSWSPIQIGLSGASPGAGDSIIQIISITGNSDGTVIYTITPTANGCVGASINDTVTLSICYPFYYSAASYCQAGLNPTPIVYSPGGVFSSDPQGLSIDPSTGTIDLASSTIGTYTIIYTNGSNSDSSTFIIVGPSANFSYSYSTYCQNASNPSPIFESGASAGVFSASPVGLVFVHINTGEIDLASSTPGTYIVTDSVSANGSCAAVGATTTITINQMDDPSFTYQSSTYSQTSIDPTPTISGLPGGIFSATPIGLSIDSLTGTINLITSALGTYTVGYTTNGACPSTSSGNVTITTTVSVNEKNINASIDVYPNPNNGHFSLSLSPTFLSTNSKVETIEIYNVLGEKIYYSEIKNQKSEIDISHQPNGLYIIRVNHSNQPFNQRLIKQ